MPSPAVNGAAVYEPASSSLSGNSAGTLLAVGEEVCVGFVLVVAFCVGL